MTTTAFLLSSPLFHRDDALDLLVRRELERLLSLPLSVETPRTSERRGIRLKIIGGNRYQSLLTRDGLEFALSPPKFQH